MSFAIEYSKCIAFSKAEKQTNGSKTEVAAKSRGDRVRILLVSSIAAIIRTEISSLYYTDYLI